MQLNIDAVYEESCHQKGKKQFLQAKWLHEETKVTSTFVNLIKENRPICLYIHKETPKLELNP